MGGNTQILNSTISGNTASEEGGGISFVGSNGLDITQSTITNNTATTYGGLYIPAPQAVPTAQAKRAAHADSQDAHKQAKAKADDAESPAPGVQAQALGDGSLVGTIVAGNTGTDIGPGGNFTSDHSLIGSVAATTVVTDQGGTIFGANPMLGPLTNNGGLTDTHALLAGSPAINTGPNPEPVFAGSEFDQRGAGFLRVVDGVADIGAFEVQPPPAEPPAAGPVVITPKFTG
jgi:parallel beta-helix repeat protein